MIINKLELMNRIKNDIKDDLYGVYKIIKIYKNIYENRYMFINDQAQRKFYDYNNNNLIKDGYLVSRDVWFNKYDAKITDFDDIDTQLFRYVRAFEKTIDYKNEICFLTLWKRTLKVSILYRTEKDAKYWSMLNKKNYFYLIKEKKIKRFK